MASILVYSAALMIPIGGVFGTLFWITIFMQTLRHFPKMDKHQRIMMSAASATLLTFILLAITYLALIFLLRGFMGEQWHSIKSSR